MYTRFVVFVKIKVHEQLVGTTS